MKILVACEFSGIVREAFFDRGHDAISCDLLPTEIPGKHIQCDVRNLNLSEFDMMICHPPCTYLAVSGARWFSDPKRQEKQKQGLEFVEFLLSAPIEKICLENPVSVISRYIQKPDQVIHPYEFGEDENKSICLWLKNLPKLNHTEIIPKLFRNSSIHREPPSKDRWKNRSRFFWGIAHAMAEQWG